MAQAKTVRLKNGTSVILRPATPDDAKGIVEALKSSSPERSSIMMEMYGKNIGAEREFIAGLKPKGNLLLVAAADQKIAGCLAAFASTQWEDRSSATVEVGLHLKDEFRGQGLGSAMLAHAILWAKQNGFRQMTSNIYATNKRSVGLFTRQGFVEDSSKEIRSGGSGILKILLRKTLA